MILKIFAVLMTVTLCLGAVPALISQTGQDQPDTKRTSAKASTRDTDDLLTQEDALVKACAHAELDPDNITILQAQLDWDDHVPEWELEFYSDSWEYDYTIHAETGKILEWDREYEPRKSTEAPTAVTEVPVQRLTKDAAQNIALEHAGLTEDQVTRLRTQYDREDGVPVYEVTFIYERWEYEYQIHAETGRILDWEKDYDD